MSRSGYTDDYDGENWDLIRWRGAVKSALRGKRGQAFLRELIAALEAMPRKELIAGGLVDKDGDCCAMGAVCLRRGITPPKEIVELEHNEYSVEYEYQEAVSKLLDIPRALVAEIAYENDEGDSFYVHSCPIPAEVIMAQRWKRMRAWAERHIAKERVNP